MSSPDGNSSPSIIQSAAIEEQQADVPPLRAWAAAVAYPFLL
ncbi:MAG: hypothetical protein BWY06_00447 [Candidatus Latescibacteria bacterium ADurb.Bin168]|nr:MAG: hypothetical protein BWY06_00447 [Candidatus Latescibacteria bacterium ADurb.Bin168]HQK23521.1 hypothetical protein [Candidatus Latescibacterota bacterium]